MTRIFKNKKGYNFYTDWAETVAVIVLVAGFYLSASAGSAFLQYVTIFLCGLMTGRMWFYRKKRLKVPFVLGFIFFIVGFVFGVFVRGYGSVIIILLLFILSNVISYYAHEKGYVR